MQTASKYLEIYTSFVSQKSKSNPNWHTTYANWENYSFFFLFPLLHVSDVYVNVCLCGASHVLLDAGAHASGSLRLMAIITLNDSSTLSVVRVSHSNPEFTEIASPASQLALWFRFYLLRLEWHLALTWVLGIRTLMLTLACERFNHGSISPASPTISLEWHKLTSWQTHRENGALVYR